MDGTCVNGPTQRACAEASGNKATCVCRFSYNPKTSALYGLSDEKRAGFVAGDVAAILASTDPNVGAGLLAKRGGGKKKKKIKTQNPPNPPTNFC
ncbi:MAG: hypothetical protein RR517_01645, partial [Pseudomonas sp.]